MNIGQIIKTNREQQNLSMNELARRAGVAQSGLSEIEAGKRQPTFDILERIVAAFNMTLVEFFSNDEPELPSYIRELINSLQHLTPDQADLLNQFIISITETSSANAVVYYPGANEPLAAHRTDNCMDDLPIEAMDNVSEFQQTYLAEPSPPPNLKYKKTSKKKEPAK